MKKRLVMGTLTAALIAGSVPYEIYAQQEEVVIQSEEEGQEEPAEPEQPEPAPSEEPQPTMEPEPTQAPEPTVEPEPTQAPAPTETPQEPTATPVPEPTTAPTETPAPTEISAQQRLLKCISLCQIPVLTHLQQKIQSLFLLISNIKTAESFTLSAVIFLQNITSFLNCLTNDTSLQVLH